MTKKQMVEEIQVAEAKAWKELQEAKKLWGTDEPITTRLRAQWSMLYELRDALGIPALSIQSLIDRDLVPA